MTTCRSCHAEIIWAVTTNGKRIPVNAEPGTGNVALEYGRPGQPPTAHVLSGPAREKMDPSNLYTAHFVTCPNAASHRRGGTRSHPDARR